MRRLLAALATVGLAVTLSACREPTAEERRDAELAKLKHEAEMAEVCESSGGVLIWDAWNGWRCQFEGVEG